MIGVVSPYLLLDCLTTSCMVTKTLSVALLLPGLGLALRLAQSTEVQCTNDSVAEVTLPLRILVTDPRLRLTRSQTGLNSSSLAGHMSGSAEAPSPRQGVRIGHPRRRVKLLYILMMRNIYRN